MHAQAMPDTNNYIFYELINKDLLHLRMGLVLVATAIFVF